ANQDPSEIITDNSNFQFVPYENNYHNLDDDESLRKTYELLACFKKDMHKFRVFSGFFGCNRQAAVWQALNHYAYLDAVFLAERLYAEVRSEEALYLLATCYYRSGKPYKAYRLLKAHSCSTPQVRFLLAKCCVELGKLAEGEQVLIGGVLNKQKSQDDIITEFGDSASFTLSLLGHIYCKTDRAAKGAECFQRSLTLNPFLWSPFQNLCHLDYSFPEAVPVLQELNRLNLESSNGKLTSDLSVSYIDSSLISPETGSLLGNTVSMASAGTLLAKQNKPKSGRSLLGGPTALSPLTPSQSGNSRDVLPIPFNQSQTSAPHTSVMALLRELGRGYQALCSYSCREAINILTSLPPQHYNTGWVLTHVGRAYFELAEYMQAERLFSEVRRIESYRVEGMEIYSTTLWHLQKDVALSALAKDLTDMDKNCPEAWCVAGNCFSLQREHDIAIKFFQRAIQVSCCYRGYHLFQVQHALKKSDAALETLNRAIGIDPKNPLCKFHRASILFANDKYKAALQELEELKQIVPKESLVYFLIGKKSKVVLPARALSFYLGDPSSPRQVYKKLGQTHLALMNFSWAMDLDPKGANNQIKEAIDKRYLPEDEGDLCSLPLSPFCHSFFTCLMSNLSSLFLSRL
ncbi:hypothetical protein GOODEAATRI_011234, partial [Goodea atripinnis]